MFASDRDKAAQGPPSGCGERPPGTYCLVWAADGRVGALRRVLLGDRDFGDVVVTVEVGGHVVDRLRVATVGLVLPERDRRHLLEDELLGVLVSLDRLVQGSRVVALLEGRVDLL